MTLLGHMWISAKHFPPSYFGPLKKNHKFQSGYSGQLQRFICTLGASSSSPSDEPRMFRGLVPVEVCRYVHSIRRAFISFVLDCVLIGQHLQLQGHSAESSLSVFNCYDCTLLPRRGASLTKGYLLCFLRGGPGRQRSRDTDWLMDYYCVGNYSSFVGHCV